MATNPHLESHHRHERETGEQADTVARLHDPHAADEHAEDEYVHVAPLSLLGIVLLILLVLTLINVVVTNINFGYETNLTVTLTIAAIKAILIGIYFMHLRWDSPFNSMVLLTALIFITLFIGISMMDSAEYAHNLTTPGGPQISYTPSAGGS